MPNTNFNEYTYPEEDKDPCFDELVSFFNQQDLCLFNNKLRSYMILAGGGTVIFDANLNSLTWTEDFIIKNCISGFVTQYRYGPDALTRSIVVYDGQIIYGVFASVSSRNEERNLSVDNKINKTDNYFILGFRYGDKLYLQNGMIL